jgi:cytochrome c
MPATFRPIHALLTAALASMTPSASADTLADARKLALNHCGACHAFGEGQPHRQGPNLWGVVGRTAATAPGFAYSDGLRNALGGRAWDAALLDRWLADPQAVAPGTVMLYRQDDPEKRAALLLFLESLH